MGSVDDCFDNAMPESLLHRLRVRHQQVDADRSILLSAEDRAKVLHGNAQRVLQL